MLRRFLALALTLVAIQNASAAVIAFTVPDSPLVLPNFVASDPVYTLGYTFTVGADDIRITKLGFFDMINDGLGTSHEITIWDSQGTVVGTATVPSGTTAALEARYRYVDLATSFVLSANTEYTIGATMYGNPDLALNLGDELITASPGVTLGERRSSNDANFPTENTKFYGQYMTANFQYEVVPEPGAYLMVGLGLASIGFVRRKRR